MIRERLVGRDGPLPARRLPALGAAGRRARRAAGRPRRSPSTRSSPSASRATSWCGGWPGGGSAGGAAARSTRSSTPTGRGVPAPGVGRATCTSARTTSRETVVNRLSVYEEQTAPLIDYYRSRGLLREVDGRARTGRGLCPDRHAHPGVGVARAAARPRRPPRGPVPKTPGEIEAMAAAGRACWPSATTPWRPRWPWASPPGASTRSPRRSSAGGGGVPGLQGLPRPDALPGLDLPVGQRRRSSTRSRTPTRCATGTSSPSTPAWCSTAGSPTRRAPYAVGDGLAAGRPPHRVTAGVARPRHRRRPRVGNRVGDIGHAVQTEVEAAGFSVVQSLVGHGVGPLDARGAPGAELRRAPARASRSPRAS